MRFTFNQHSAFAFFPFSRKIFSLFLICLFCTVGVFSQNSYQMDKDSLLKIIPTLQGEEKLNAMQLLSRLPYPADETQLMFKHNKEYVEEARKQKDIKHEASGMLDELFNYFNLNRRQDFLEKAPSYLAYFEEKGQEKQYYKGYQVLVETYIYEGNFEKALNEAQIMYDKARAQNSSFGLDTSTYLLGYIHFMQHDYVAAKSFLTECIQLQKTRKPVDWDLLFEAYADIIALHPAVVDTEEAVALMNDYRKSILIYENDVRKTHKLWRPFYNASLNVHIYLGELDKAMLYCDSVELHLGNSIGALGDLYLSKGNIAELKGNYKQAYEYYTEAYEKRLLAGNDVLGARMSQIRALYKLQDGEEAYSLTIDLLSKRDSMYNFSVNAQLNELRTVYEVDKLTAEKEINRQRLIFAIGGCALLVIILLVYIIYSRRLKTKNIGLVKQIQEQDRLDKELKEERAELEKLRKTFKNESDNQINEQDKLFERMEALMEMEQPYTSSSLNRKNLSDMLGTNEKYLREAIKKHLDITVNEYISLWRLKHAKDLLLLPPEEYTIEAVAVDSGFGSRSTFHTLFRNHYGLTPDEFRKIINKKR